MNFAASIGRYGWMKVADVMTKEPVTIAAGETVGQAEELMSENNIRQIPVVNGRDLLGIVTDRDLRSFLSGPLLGDPEARESALRTPVRDVMTMEPIFVSPNDDLEEVVEILIEEKIGGIPVVDQTEGLVGIVTYIDLLRCFLNRIRED